MQSKFETRKIKTFLVFSFFNVTFSGIKTSKIVYYPIYSPCYVFLTLYVLKAQINQLISYIFYKNRVFLFTSLLFSNLSIVTYVSRNFQNIYS